MRLRILLVEDAAADAELITRELQASKLPFVLTRVETESAFRHELAAHPPDLILSDHGLPTFSGFKALEIVRAERPNLPFIFVSGSNDPGMVAQMYEAGATDYVFKHDLVDLKNAVLQALETAEDAWLRTAANETTAAQSELNLNLPEPDPQSPVITQSVGQLSFCPRCRCLRDETGSEVAIENYCSSRAEIVILREVCVSCEPRSLAN
jgi:CheY-like chemotaxis protein